MATSNGNGINTVIPQYAVEIKVTNVINPYFIRIYKVSDDQNKKNNLSRSLQKVLRHQLKKESNSCTFTFGDDVIVSNNRINNEKVDLPDWICRGVITDTTTKTTDVFLLDYGIVVNVPTESLVKYPRSFVSVETLTFTVGLFNILPVNSKFQLSKEWPRSTIDFIKELIQTSKKIYFEDLAYNKSTNKLYGDIFLVTENQNMSLSQVLIHSLMAVPLYDELLEAMKSNNNNDKDQILVPYNLRGGQEQNIKNNDIPTQSIDDYPSVNERQRKVNLKKKQMNEKVLIRSKFECQRLEHIADSRFTANVHKALQNQGVRTLKQIQRYMWPAIKQGLNVAVISPKSSGKTIGYTIPIVSCITANEEIILEKHAKTAITKPIALVLCASVNKCIDVAAKCKDAADYHPKIKAYAAFNGLTDKQLMTSILNKFHILVSTPPFLLRLLKKYPNKLAISELSFLILDNADILLKKYLSEIMALIRNYKIINKDDGHSIQGGLMQIVTVADTWTDKICSFVNMFMKDPFICIASYTEAAAFCRVQGRMLIRHSEQKKTEVLDKIGDYLNTKTMIFCVNSKEATELNDFLVSNSVKTVLVHEEMKMIKILEIRKDWTKYLPGMYPVIISTDQVLSELEISDIEFLIHYTVTDTSKTEFNRRFSVLMDNWLLELKSKCKVLILFDETKDNMHFKGVVNILKRLNVDLPNDWNELADGLDLANNKKKKNYPLCDSIKAFGACEENSCPYRHRIITEVDGPSTSISIGDELKLHVTYVHTASHLAARVLERTRKCEVTGKTETTTFPFEILKLDMNMTKYYSDPKNRKMLKDVRVGEICAFRSAENKFSRVQILNVEEKDIRTDKPKAVRIRCIDDGQILRKVSVIELKVLPEEFLQYQTSIIDIFLTGVAPFDEENKWTDIANKDTQNWFKKNCSTTSFVHGKVLLHVGHSVWTDSLVIRSKLIGYPDLVSSSLSNILKKHEHGTENKNHLNNLLQLCHSGGLTEVNGHPIQLYETNNPMDDCD